MSCETHATVHAVASSTHAREAPVGVRTVSTPVHVAERDGRLAGSLPLAIVSRHGVRRLQLMGGEHAALGDVLLAVGEPRALAGALGTAGADLAPRRG